MRFIGSKATMLKNIEAVINENTTGEENIFCDIFSGTAAVASYFKPKYEIISNDLLHFSYVIQKSVIENNEKPNFARLKSIGIIDPLEFLEEAKIQTDNLSSNECFITKNYSPSDDCDRMYITRKNAQRIDFIRNTINVWKNENLITETEYYYLLAALIEGVPSVSNITGTYGAYLKQWDKRAFKELEMVRLEVIDNKRDNASYNKDANALIREVEGDILYIDPPYNSRQYTPNYHLLETISKCDCPKISGVTGMRPYKDEKSRFCIKNEVSDAFEDLIAHAHFANIVVSYSTEGLMTYEQIENILKKYGMPRSFKRYDIPYRKYKSKIPSELQALCENIYYIKKDMPKKQVFDLGAALKYNEKKESQKSLVIKKYIKSPLNYIGGKYKLLPQLLPLFPRDIATFVDLFSGGCNLAINITADKIICNDINSKIVELFETYKRTDIDAVILQIEKNIKQYGLSKENEEGFKKFRNYYNNTGDPIDLYTLTCYSFNYQFRFNNGLKYNNPFGRNRSMFSEQMRQNLIAFASKLKKIDIEFLCRDFTEIDLKQFTPSDLIYCDPPYFITTGTYNDGNRGFKDWNEKEERALYDYLDKANKLGVRFALSNVLEHKGRINGPLIEWSKKYRVIKLNSDYSNSSYNTKKGNSREVLIVNY